MRLLLFVLIVFIGLFLFMSSLRPNYNVIISSPLVDIPSNNIDPSKIKGDLLKTYEDENYYSLNGIDVSEHQGEIDFSTLKDQGIEFVYLRLGYRSYGDGSLHLDACFEENYQKAKEAGLLIGVYFFSQAINEKEAIDEAYFVKDNLKGKSIDLHVVYDLEDISYDTSRMSNTSKEVRVNNAMSFAAKIKDLGYEPMIYTNLHWTYEYYDLSYILNYPIWYAQYNAYPENYFPIKIWQYSESGILEGIDTKVDLNMMLVEK